MRVPTVLAAMAILIPATGVTAPAGVKLDQERIEQLTGAKGKLDGKERFKRTLDRAPTGRCGLWSKADSKVLFNDFEASP